MGREPRLDDIDRVEWELVGRQPARWWRQPAYWLSERHWAIRVLGWTLWTGLIVATFHQVPYLPLARHNGFVADLPGSMGFAAVVSAGTVAQERWERHKRIRARRRFPIWDEATTPPTWPSISRGPGRHYRARETGASHRDPRS